MIHDNAALKPQSIPSPSRGIHLVYSRTWKTDAAGRHAMSERIQMPQVRDVRESRTMATLTLGVAALSAPAIWVGHAILHWLHIL